MYYIAGTPARRQVEQNAASHARPVKEGQHSGNNGPTGQGQEKVNDDAGNNPDDDSSETSEFEDDPRSEHNPLDQDYAQHLMSVQPQLISDVPMQSASNILVRAPPTATIGATQSITSKPKMGQGRVPISTQGHVESKHDRQQIKNLRDHIWESLSKASTNLPEPKGVHLKQPDAYEGKDDYDRLEEWLRGLVQFFKLHCLTGMDKEDDRVLVTGTCLKGKVG